MYNNELMHYRTKGSKNGFSKDPNYTPIGEKAKGVLTGIQNAASRVGYQAHMAAQGKQMSIGNLRKQETEQTPERNMYDVATGKIKNAYIHAKSRARLAARSAGKSIDEKLGVVKNNKFVRDTGEILERAGSKISTASGKAAAGLKKSGTELLKSVRNNTIGRYKRAKLEAGSSSNPYSAEYNRQNTPAGAAKVQQIKQQNAARIAEEQRLAEEARRNENRRQSYEKVKNAGLRVASTAKDVAKDVGSYLSNVAKNYNEAAEATRNGQSAEYIAQKQKEAEERRKRAAKTAHNWINRNDPYRNG